MVQVVLKGYIWGEGRQARTLTVGDLIEPYQTLYGKHKIRIAQSCPRIRIHT